jgi:hypothetical protein
MIQFVHFHPLLSLGQMSSRPSRRNFEILQSLNLPLSRRAQGISCLFVSVRERERERVCAAVVADVVKLTHWRKKVVHAL